MRRQTRFVRLAAGVSELTLTPEALLSGYPRGTWRSPPLGEMVLNLSGWRANRDYVRVPVPWLSVLAQAALRVHCWLRKCTSPEGKSDCRASPSRRMTTPCHNGPRENGRTPWLRAC